MCKKKKKRQSKEALQVKLENFTATFSEKNNDINHISGDNGQQTESDRSKSKKF